jgi:hypothetical protein
VEPVFADWNGDTYDILVETEAHEGAAIVRIYHPQWKHRCLHFKLSESYERQEIEVLCWTASHPTEDWISCSEKFPSEMYKFGDFGAVVNHFTTMGYKYYKKLREDEKEAQRMAREAMKQPELRMFRGER